MYKKYIKRILDIICALFVIIFFFWLFLIIAIMVRVKLGSPIIFKQPRPGKKNTNGQESIFYMYKYRSMTDEKDADGKLLPDDVRLTTFGRKIRDWSLDELPEVWNILKGDMSVVGPRPQLVCDLVFMTNEHRRRHEVKPGLTGLAQVSGRNAISWDRKLAIDLEYINNISFLNDLKIVLLTVKKVFIREGINAEGKATVDDYGDVLLKEGKVSQSEYEFKQNEARRLMNEAGY